MLPSIAAHPRKKEVIRAPGPRLDDSAGARARAMPPGPDVAIDAHDLVPGAEPDEVEREAHRECMHRPRAQPQGTLGRKLVEAAQPTAPRQDPARLVHVQSAAELASRQAPEAPLPRPHRRAST